jgi:hypothetical protein
MKGRVSVTVRKWYTLSLIRSPNCQTAASHTLIGFDLTGQTLQMRYLTGIGR